MPDKASRWKKVWIVLVLAAVAVAVSSTLHWVIEPFNFSISTADLDFDASPVQITALDLKKDWGVITALSVRTGATNAKPMNQEGLRPVELADGRYFFARRATYGPNDDHAEQASKEADKGFGIAASVWYLSFRWIVPGVGHAHLTGFEPAATTTGTKALPLTRPTL